MRQFLHERVHYRISSCYFPAAGKQNLSQARNKNLTLKLSCVYTISIRCKHSRIHPATSNAMGFLLKEEWMFYWRKKWCFPCTVLLCQLTSSTWWRVGLGCAFLLCKCFETINTALVWGITCPCSQKAQRQGVCLALWCEEKEFPYTGTFLKNIL